MTRSDIPGDARRGYATTANGQVHYRRAGAGRGLLLVHQSPSSHAMWDPVLPGFAARGYDVVALDLPGHGQSDPWPGGEPALEDYAAAVEATAEELRMAEYDLVGHHAGVAVAAAVAVRRPDRVGRLVGWGVPLMEPQARQAMAEEAAPAYDRSAGEVIARWKWFWDRAAESVQPDVVVRSILEVLQTGPRRAEAHHALGRADVEALLRALPVPMLALAGPREMLREESARCAELSEAISYEEIPDGGFFVVDEQPGTFVDAVDRFLRG
jgi:pimeloyl-ACP methyl ester carboxylesterase